MYLVSSLCTTLGVVGLMKDTCVSTLSSLVSRRKTPTTPSVCWTRRPYRSTGKMPKRSFFSTLNCDLNDTLTSRVHTSIRTSSGCSLPSPCEISVLDDVGPDCNGWGGMLVQSLPIICFSVLGVRVDVN